MKPEWPAGRWVGGPLRRACQLLEMGVGRAWNTAAAFIPVAASACGFGVEDVMRVGCDMFRFLG
jgi:hypothetical protein